MPSAPHHTCGSCRAPLAPDQRYCLQCGARRGAPRVEPTLAWRSPADPAVPAVAAVATTAFRGAGGLRVLRPSRSISAVLSGAALLAGGLLGVLIGAPAASSSLAAARQPPIVVAVPPAVTTTAAAPEPGPVEEEDPTVETITVTTEAETPVAEEPVEEEPAAEETTPADTTTETIPTETTEEPTTPHVWVVTLTGQDAPALFGAQAPPYFAELAKQGAVLDGYAPLAGGSIPNGVALLSGQAPNPATLAGCPTYDDVPADTYDATTTLIGGAGCVYPTSVVSLPDQLAATGLTWRAYVQGTGDLCLPNPRNPFLSFHSLVDNGGCAKSVAGVETLASDLADTTRTPALSWIVPDALHDGRDGTTPDGVATGPQDAAAFLQDVIPTITATQAYEDGGLIVIVPDGARTPDAATGALLLGPTVEPGVRPTAAQGPYHLLRSLEDLLGLGHLGHAGDTTVVPLDKTVFKETDPDAASRRLSQSRTRPGGHVAAHPPAR